MNLLIKKSLVVGALAALLGANTGHAFTLESLPEKDSGKLYFNVKNGVATLYGSSAPALTDKLAKPNDATQHEKGILYDLTPS